MNNSLKELEVDLNEYDTKTRNTPWRIVIHYFVLGFFWIVFSDKILSYLIKDFEIYGKVQIYKGWLYIAITSVFLYYFIKLNNSQILKLSKKILSKNEELENTIISMEKITNELTEQKSYINEIYNSSNTAMVICNLNGEVIEVSNYFKELLGYEDDDIIGEEWIDIIIPKEEKSKMHKLISQLKAKHKILNFENKVITKDGKILNMIWNHSLIENITGKESVILSFGMDVTKQRNQEKKLLR